MRGDVPEWAKETLDDWLARNGLTLGAYLEAVAELIRDVGTDPDALFGQGPRVIERARIIAHERARRPRPPAKKPKKKR